MAHEHEVVLKEEKFQMTAKDKRVTLSLMGVGLALALIGIFTSHDHMLGKRIWANLLVDSYFLFIICACATAFITIKALANAGWHITIKRIPEAMGTFIPIAAAVILVVLLVGGKDLYHWMQDGITDPKSTNYDKILDGKSWYLNKTFFYIRFALFLGVTMLVTRNYRKWSMQEDIEGGLSAFNKTYKTAAFYLFFFAFTFSAFSWDIVMSIDAHWFSTIFSIYNFATGWVSCITIIALFAMFLKKRGYLSIVNEDVMHDLGKMMFAFSIFWTYMWVAQMLLIWYANLPEEITYYQERVHNGWGFHFYLNIAINFVLPFFALMSRDAKRNPWWLGFIGCLLLFGHWNDVYLMIFPGAMKGHDGISHAPGWGLIEIGFLCVFIGGFIHVVLASLSKANLYPYKHPYVKESALHDVGV